jgi:hypothetical protein
MPCFGMMRSRCSVAGSTESDQKDECQGGAHCMSPIG